MKKLAALSVLAFAGSAFATGSTPLAGGGLIISEVVDGTLPGGLPKWVELTNTGTSSIDLSNYSFGNFNNGGTTLGGGAASVLTGTLAPGASFVLAYEAEPVAPAISSFEDVYGFTPDFYMGGAFTNGDDAYALYFGAATGDGSDATIQDVYGVIGIDGTGEAWDYTDSYSYSEKSRFAPNAGAWNATNWFVAGANALEDVDDIAEEANLLAFTTPGTHVWTPAPGAAALLGLAGFVGARRRRA
ncbi:MAG: hypothetical protein Tsb0013_01270 [Phycisphaerales bacterium]